jgi:hypothetical protein
MDEIFKIKLNDTSGKGLYTLVDKDIYELYKDKNIGLDQMGYPCFSQNGRPQRLHKLVLLNIPSRNRILRKNNDKLDNRRDNLYCNIEIIKLLPEYEFIVTNNGISKSFNHWLYDNTVNYNVVIAKYKEFIKRSGSGRCIIGELFQNCYECGKTCVNSQFTLSGDAPGSEISLPRTMKIKIIANPAYWGFAGSNDDNVMVSGYAYFSNGHYDFFYGFDPDWESCRTCGRYADEVCSANDNRPDISYRSVVDIDGSVDNYYSMD